MFLDLETKITFYNSDCYFKFKALAKANGNRINTSSLGPSASYLPNHLWENQHSTALAALLKETQTTFT